MRTFFMSTLYLHSLLHLPRQAPCAFLEPNSRFLGSDSSNLVSSPSWTLVSFVVYGFSYPVIDTFRISAHSQDMSTIALTELLGSPVLEASGAQCGRVREVALTPAEDRNHVSTLIVRTKKGDRLLPFSAVSSLNGGVRASSAAADWAGPEGEGLFLLERDLLDQQIIDVHGRKVVRVNDVDMHLETGNGRLQLKIGSVDVGTRGAVRRLLKGIVPIAALKPLLHRIPPRLIPWTFVHL